ncbi:HrcA family transcriptional regulator [Sulfurospirillum sp. 1307]
MNKRDIILEAIIEEYLNHKEPIGSVELQMRMNISISPSTIRIYLKRLSEEGALAQLHVSSGRVPTQKALIEYWQNRLDTSSVLKIDSVETIETSLEEYELYCVAQKNIKDYLKEVINVNKRYLILSFEEHEVVLKYSDKVERFLNNLIGCEIRDLKNISSQVGLYELHDKLVSLINSSDLLKAGEAKLYEIAKEVSDEKFLNYLLDSEFTLGLKDGVYFDGFVPSGCLALKQPALIEEEDAEIFCFGTIDSNFKSFLKNF